MNLKEFFELNYLRIEELRKSKDFRWVTLTKELNLPNNKAETVRAAYKTYRSKLKTESIYDLYDKDPKEWKISNLWHKGENKMSVNFIPLKNNESTDYIKEFQNYLKTYKYKPLDEVELSDVKQGVFVLALADLHIGKQKSKDYLLKIRRACKLLVSPVKDRVKELIILNTGDLLHIDNISGTTTKGTQLDYEESFESNFITALSFINSLISDMTILLDSTQITFINVRGNHDFNTSFCIGEALKERYFNSKSISIKNEFGNRLYHYSCGNAFLFTHGDKALNKLPLIFATEGSDYFSKAKYRHILLGHLHHTQSKEYFTDQMEFMGIDSRVINSPCKNDRYHSLEGYIGARKTITLFGYNENGKFYESIETII